MMNKLKIKDLAKQIRGVSYKTSDLHEELDSQSVILLRANNISNGLINFDDVIYVDKQKVSEIQYLKKGDILICASSGSKKLVGKAASVDFDMKCTFGAFCKVVRPKVEYMDYLGFYFQSSIYRNKISKASLGANINNIRNEHIDGLEVPLYSKENMSTIIKRMQLLQKIIINIKQELKLLDELVKARFVELFGDIISNDKNWNSKPLKELCDISRGASPRPISDYLGGAIPWIKIGDATIGDSIYINSTKEHIIKEGVRKSRFIKKGSLIFANCGVSLGFCRIINFDGCIHDGWLAFQNIDTSLNKIFLLTTINQMTGYFRKIAPGGTQPNLNTDIVGNYIQVVPPIELQNQFANFVKEVDKSRLEVQKSLKKTQELFDSLMQKYFG